MIMTCHIPLLPGLSLIDISPLQARVERLCASICRLSQQPRLALQQALALRRTVKIMLNGDRRNRRIKLKIQMLNSPGWRARVLRDLGGETALSRWERLSGVSGQSKDISKPHASIAQKQARAANLKKARTAKAAKLERTVRSGTARKAGDDTHPNSVFDRVKVDRDGVFRLAPILRGPRKGAAEKIKAATAKNIPASAPRYKIKYVKANPIPVWPAEFKAAEKVQREGRSRPIQPSYSISVNTSLTSAQTRDDKAGKAAVGAEIPP